MILSVMSLCSNCIITIEKQSVKIRQIRKIRELTGLNPL